MASRSCKMADMWFRFTHSWDSPQARTRRGFLEAMLVSVSALLAVGVIWLVGRRGQSAGRDPEFMPPVTVPPRTSPTATPGTESG
jgi:hypothetical protein